MSKVQETGCILRVDFTQSKKPHFNSAYLVKVRFSLDLGVYRAKDLCTGDFLN